MINDTKWKKVSWCFQHLAPRSRTQTFKIKVLSANWALTEVPVGVIVSLICEVFTILFTAVLSVTIKSKVTRDVSCLTNRVEEKLKVLTFLIWEKVPWQKLLIFSLNWIFTALDWNNLSIFRILAIMWHLTD